MVAIRLRYDPAKDAKRRLNGALPDTALLPVKRRRNHPAPASLVAVRSPNVEGKTLPDKPRSNRGFASMDASKQRDIARKGGESVPNEKRSFSRNPQLAAEAGRKGGRSVAPEARSFSRDPKLAAEAGRKGGEASHSSRRDDQSR